MSDSHKAFLVASTQVIHPNLELAMQYLEAPEWLQNKDPSTDAELLVEFAGRLCYKSFKPGLNPNVTKVREGNREYLGNVLKQKHGSIFEHATVTFALLNVSRILTHELVRHRVGIAFSQESQRFVRMDNFSMYIPDLTDALTEIAESVGHTSEWVQVAQAYFVSQIYQTQSELQEVMAAMISGFELDHKDVSFHAKKTITSALRRLLPGGINTNILVTANHRTWRHIIENRTSTGAEVEIIEVMNDVAHQLQAAYPNIYQDMTEELTSKRITFSNQKI